jgi:hypothetical protein
MFRDPTKTSTDPVDGSGSSGASGHGATKLAGACAIAALEKPVEVRNIPKACGERDFGNRRVSSNRGHVSNVAQNAHGGPSLEQFGPLLHLQHCKRHASYALK